MALLKFESLEVFKRAYAVLLELHRVSLVFPSVEQFGLADQLRRASKSICANIAEGMGKARKLASRATSLFADGDWFGG